MAYGVITFYKFVDLTDAAEWAERVRHACEAHGLLGRILLGEEGINGGVSGQWPQLHAFKAWLRAQEPFADITFRELPCLRNAYHKRVVRVRDEIVAMGRKVDHSQTAPYLSPAELDELYARGEDIVLVDTRNDYEYEVGHFENAIKLPMRTFREFEDSLESIADLKDKTIATYCTGGIRCEKATVLMKEKGFRNVLQLQGGIIEYLNQTQGKHWQGGLFVFDDRLIYGQPLAGEHPALDTMAMASIMPDPEYRTVGRVLNYFARAGMAYVDLQAPLAVGDRIILSGPTTGQFSMVVEQLREDALGDLQTAAAGQQVTFPVERKVRRNDRILQEVVESAELSGQCTA